MVKIDVAKAGQFLSGDEIKRMAPQVKLAAKMLKEKTGAGNDFLGWVDLPVNYDADEFKRVQAAAEKIKADSDFLIVIGIGGSYLGAKAAIELLGHSFSPYKQGKPKVLFAGNNISGTYLSDLIDIIGDKDFSINVISKSGTTTEPAIAFRIFRDLAIKKYGDKACERIYATTDKSRGALKSLADREGYECFVIPDDVGGRYSVLTPVGLLPIAVSGADITKLMDGAAAAYEEYQADDNPCYTYAAARNALYNKGKNIEILVNYEPSLHYVSEWWKQLYGESEGKEQKGIFPAAVDNSCDLHSMGQYIQDGRRCIFETVLNVLTPRKDITLGTVDGDIDGLNFLSGKTMDFTNKMAFMGTLLAHADGGVPSLVVSMDALDEFSLGNLFYFFEKACGISGYLLGVNPFDQPGVENYKKNMFALLGKPGYEELKAKLTL